MKTLGPSLVLLEATGGLELPLVAALAAEALPVVVVNPRQVRDFARALAKTDALDAAVLAHFGDPAPRASSARRRNPGAQLPHCPEAAGDDDASEKNRLGAATSAVSPHCGPHHLVGAGSKRP